LKLILKYHVYPILISSLLLILQFKYDYIYILLLNTNKKEKIISGVKLTINGRLATMVESEKSELELYGSLLDKEGITLLASSELSNISPYITYHFLPDSLGIRVNSFGHAYQQCFSIFSELLAFKKELKDAKITIILSPGWFEQGGSNIEAFLEFVRPNFLKRIINDHTITTNQKAAIGEFLFKNYELIKNPNSLIEYFISIYKKRSFLNNDHVDKSSVLSFENVIYVLNKNKSIKYNHRKINFDSIALVRQNQMLKLITNNNFYINNEYYEKYLLDKNGKMIYSDFPTIDIKNNQEFKDFKMLVDLLVECKSKPTFMIQGLSPYYFNNLKGFDPVLNGVVKYLEQKNIPYLNMFTSSKDNFVPASLLDVMHSSDYTWMKYNKFLVENYFK
jgi:D-alanine transfer protein